MKSLSAIVPLPVTAKTKMLCSGISLTLLKGNITQAELQAEPGDPW
jgi:hypothetical protein